MRFTDVVYSVQNMKERKDVIWGAVERAFSGDDQCLGALYGVPSDVSECARKLGYQGLFNLKVIGDELVEYTYNRSLTECQSACLALCAASYTLDYTPPNGIHPLNKILNDQEGDCKAYSRIGDYYAGRLGVASHTVVGTGHMFLEMKVDGNWYFAEPQLDKCRFFSR